MQYVMLQVHLATDKLTSQSNIRPSGSVAASTSPD